MASATSSTTTSRRRWRQRLNASGYPATLAVENVSAGYHTLAEAFSAGATRRRTGPTCWKNGVTKLGIAASYAPKYQIQGILDAHYGVIGPR